MLSDGQERERATSAAGPLRFLLSLLFTFTGNFYLLFGTIFFTFVTLAVGWIPLPRGGRVFFWLARWWSSLLLLSSGRSRSVIGKLAKAAAGGALIGRAASGTGGVARLAQTINTFASKLPLR